MEIDFINEWKKSIEVRKDLYPIYKNKVVTVCLKTEKDTCFIFFDRGKIIIEKNIFKAPDVWININEEAGHQVFQGEERLTLIPQHIMRCEGKYRDILFLESIFYLTQVMPSKRD